MHDDWKARRLYSHWDPSVALLIRLHLLENKGPGVGTSLIERATSAFMLLSLACSLFVQPCLKRVLYFLTARI